MIWWVWEFPVEFVGPLNLPEYIHSILQDLEERLKKAHDDDMLSQLKASQLSIDVVKSQADEKRQRDLAEERVKFEREKNILENELLRRRKDEIGKVKKDFESQLSLLKIQVHKADELRSKEVGATSENRK